MQIIKPSVIIESEIDGQKILKHIEKIGRTCYKSEDRIAEDSAEKFVKNVVSRGHESVIEHFNISARFICDRGVSHELCRHRIASFSQESSRYVNYQKRGMEFILPCWFKSLGLGEYCYYYDHVDGEKVVQCPVGIDLVTIDFNERQWLFAMLEAEQTYNEMIVHGWTPEQARSVLPNSLKTEIVMTTNLREYRHILKLRTSKAAHPQIREIMLMLLEQLEDKIPIVFDDIEGEV